MRSKLVFPSGGMETKYVWNKSTINDKGVYVWDKNKIVNIDTHYWNKCQINYNLDINVYNWDRYLPYINKYKWDKYTYTTKYYWDKYSVLEGDVPFKAIQYNDFENINLYSNTKFSLDYGWSSDLSGRYYIGTDDDTIFTFYYTTASSRGSVNKISSKSFTLLELYNKLRLDDEIYQYDTNIIGMSCSKNRMAGYAVIPQRIQDSFYIDKESDNLFIKYGVFGSSVWVSEEALKNGYWTYESDEVIITEALAYKHNYVVPTNTPISGTGEIVNPTLPTSFKLQDEPLFNCYKPIINSNGLLYVSTVYTNIEKDEEVLKGDLIERINSTNRDAYPTNGIKDGYFYKLVLEEEVPDKTEFIESVYSTDAETYPQDGIQDGFWYIFDTAQQVQLKYKWNVYDAIKTNEIEYFKGSRYKKETANEAGITFYISGSAFWDEKPLPQISYTITPNQNVSFNTDEYNSNYKQALVYYQADVDATSNDNRLTFAMVEDYFENFIELQNINLSGTNLILVSIESIYYLITDQTTVYKNGDSYTLNNISKLTYTIEGYNYNHYIDEWFHIGNTTETEEYKQSNGSYLIPLYVPEARQAHYVDETEEKYSSIEEEGRITLDEETANALIDLYNQYGIIGKEGDPRYYYNGYYYSFYPYFKYGKGEFNYTTTSTDINQYPADGVAKTGSLMYWYELIGTNKDDADLKYLYVDTVSSLVENAYPKKELYGEYFYEYTGYTQGYLSAGEIVEEVSSLDKNTYPLNGIQDEYWYVYTKTVRTYQKGEYVERQEAVDEEAYPKDGIKGNYWYVFKGWEDTSRYEGKFIQQVETTDPNAYPTNGISKNYWYKFVKSYEGYKLVIDDSDIKGGIEYNLDINPEADYIVGTVSCAEISFDYNNVNRDIQKYIDANECIYYTWQPADNDWRKMGVFYLEDITEIRDTIKIKAYDSINKTEAYIDELIESITTWPLSLKDLFNKTCEFLGLESATSVFLPISNEFINDNFEAINITGRQLLQYIAEAAGGFITATPDGKVFLSKYISQSVKSLDKSKYTKYLKHNYQTDTIEGLNVRITSDDMGISAGADSGNVYIVENNPLFFDSTNNSTVKAVNDLYSQLKDISYIPAEVEMLQDYGINCGDIIKVDNNIFYVMSKNLSASGCKIKCVGNKHRQLKESGLNSDIIALRGKTNELFRDLERTKSTLTDVEADLRTEISQTAEEVKIYASNLNQQLNSSITVKLNNITSEVNNLEKELTTKIEQTESSISSIVTEQGKVITEIRQDLDGIDLVYNSENGTASITIGDITVTDLVNGEYVTRTVAGIDLTGYVTFHSLETAGETVINGSNITTGTINADRINMTGAISWGDLSSDVQDAIDAGVSGGDDLPDYIKSTYIDEVSIMSPEIIGGSITQTSGGRTTVIEDTQVLFKVKEDGVAYEVGCIDAYTDGAGTSTSAKSGLAIRSYWDGSGYSGGMKLEANRGITMAAGQDIYFYIPGHQGVALSTILTKLGL